MNVRALAIAVFSSVCAACAAVGPDYRRPVEQLPEAWSRSVVGAGEGAVELERWWTALSDERLALLIERALRSNLDLALATARVREARAALGAAGSQRFPSLDAGAGYARTRQSLESRGGGPFFGRRENDLYDAGFDANWELDVFGGVRRSVEAAQADLEEIEERRSATLTSLIAEVARAYVELRGLQRRLQVANERVTAQRELAEIVRELAEAGVASELDASRADAQLASGLSEVPALEARTSERIHALAVLLGEPPKALGDELAVASGVPAPDSELALEQPVELLRRRPDVRAAERRAAAESARVGAAIADRYPRVSLGASFGWIANDSGDLFRSSSVAASVFPRISLPLFDAGLRRSRVEEAGAREEVAVLEYQAAVLDAAKEVEDALSAFASSTERRATLRTAVEAQTRASRYALDLYTGGVTDFLTVLDAERERFLFEDLLAQSEADAALQFVALAKALGGGWEPDADRAGAGGAVAETAEAR